MPEKQEAVVSVWELNRERDRGWRSGGGGVRKIYKKVVHEERLDTIIVLPSGRRLEEHYLVADYDWCT